MRNIEFLKILCETPAPGGREDWIYPVIKEGFKKLGTVSIGKLNNIYIHKSGKSEDSIMLMAHGDEIFLMVSEICGGGFVKFVTKGVDSKVLTAQEVIVHGKEDILGIVCERSTHLAEGEDSSLLIDTGLSEESIKEKIKVGDYVTVKRSFIRLQGDNVSCKAIDNRAGIAAIYECMKSLAQVKHELSVDVVISSLEELGSLGARTGSNAIKPALAVIIDTTFDNGPLGDTERENVIGGGPVICFGPSLNASLRKKICDTAIRYHIPYQIEVEPGNTGTDAWEVEVAGRAIPVALVSIPIKYMHTSVEVVNIEDIKNTGILLGKLIVELCSTELEGALCF